MKRRPPILGGPAPMTTVRAKTTIQTVDTELTERAGWPEAEGQGAVGVGGDRRYLQFIQTGSEDWTRISIELCALGCGAASLCVLRGNVWGFLTAQNRTVARRSTTIGSV